MTEAELRARWDAGTAGAINQSLVRGKAVDSPYGSVDDRVDLRGIEIREFIKGKKIESFDFSAAVREFAGQFGMSTVVDCVFRGATIDTNLGTRFERCFFDTAKVNGVVLRGVFVDCSFQKANLTTALGDSVTFERCTFDGANLRKAQLTASHFIDCSFTDTRFGSGSLASSTFIGSAPRENQLGTTLMERCSLPESQA